MVKNILYVTAVFLSFFTGFFKLQHKGNVAFGQSVFKFSDKKTGTRKCCTGLISYVCGSIVFYV